SPAVESVVRHCLEPDVRRRYQSAGELAEDLNRQLAHRRLRHAPEPSLKEIVQKWLRRHPRLASSAGVGTVGAGLLLALVLVVVARGQRLQRLEALDSLEQFRGDLRRVQFLFLNNPAGDPDRFDEGRQLCRNMLARYHVLDGVDWQNSPLVRA